MNPRTPEPPNPRTPEPEPHSSCDLRTIRVDEAARCAHAGGSRLDLTQTEFELLRHLVHHRGEPQTRETLLKTVWRNRHAPGTNLVKAHVRNLRQKLGALGSRLVTVRGEGYVIIE